jgi:hypothetical protein
MAIRNCIPSPDDGDRVAVCKKSGPCWRFRVGRGDDRVTHATNGMSNDRGEAERCILIPVLE